MINGRQVGNTTHQMLAAPIGAYYVWANGQLDYPKHLAENIGRSDLNIVSPAWIEEFRWCGIAVKNIIIDHAYCPLTPRQWHMLELIWAESGKW